MLKMKLKKEKKENDIKKEGGFLIISVFLILA
jgi:hypothetical protein